MHVLYEFKKKNQFANCFVQKAHSTWKKDKILTENGKPKYRMQVQFNVKATQTIQIANFERISAQSGKELAMHSEWSAIIRLKIGISSAFGHISRWTDN